MKLKLFSTAVALGIVAFGVNANAQDESLMDRAKNYIIAQFISSIDHPGNIKTVCQPGEAKLNVTEGTYSVRSGKGILCQQFDSVAAIGQIVCKDFEGFQKSQCNLKTSDKIKNDPGAVLKETLPAAYQKICDNKAMLSQTTGVLGKIAKSCPTN